MAHWPSHTRFVLEAHQRASAPAAGRARAEQLALGVDHLVFDERWSPLVIASLRGLGVQRVAPEVVLADSATGMPRPSVMSPERRGRFEELRRLGVHVTRPGDPGGIATYRERFAAPGKLVAALGFSAASVGAIGAYAIPCDVLEAAAILVGGALVRPHPAVIGLALRGTLPARVDGTDLRLEVARRLALAGATADVVEFGGSGVAALTIGDRITLCANPQAFGAEAVLMPSDEVTRRYLKSLGREADWKPLPGAGRPEWEPDDLVDLGDLEPMIAPLEDPGAARPVRYAAGLSVDRVVFGPELSWEQLARAMRMIEGGSIAASCALEVRLGSRVVREAAASAGWLATLAEAGARLVDGATPARGARPDAVVLRCGGSPDEPAERHVRGFVASVETCMVAALAGRLGDPREFPGESLRPDEPERYALDASAVVRPRADEARADAPAASWFPVGERLERPLRGTVLVAVGDRVSSEQILPWGARGDLYGSDPETLAAVALRPIDPGFAARARRHHGGFVIAGVEFGGGPHAELAALVLRWLGIRALLVRGYAAGMPRHLVNAGILPLRLRDAAQARSFARGDELELPDLPGVLEVGAPVVVRNLTRGLQAALGHELGQLEIGVLVSGGILAHASSATGAALRAGR